MTDFNNETIIAISTVEDEWNLLPANAPDGSLLIFMEAESGQRYLVGWCRVEIGDDGQGYAVASLQETTSEEDAGENFRWLEYKVNVLHGVTIPDFIQQMAANSLFVGLGIADRDDIDWRQLQFIKLPKQPKPLRIGKWTLYDDQA